MPWWLTAALWVGFTLLGELLRPKPGIQHAQAAGLNQFNFPTATEDRAIPVVWGICLTEAPNVVWYGDYRAVPITKKVKTGLFSKKRVTVGYQYYIGMHLALCHRGASVLEVRAGDKVLWTGTALDADVFINLPAVFGGDEKEGGVVGTFTFASGGPAQAVHPYLASRIGGSVPAFRGVTAAIWQGGYIGTSPYIKPFAFVLRRLPTRLGSGLHDIGGDANPAEALYEALIDADWGAGLDAGAIDTASFQAAATTLHNEGHGLSMLWDARGGVDKVCEEILRQIDGVFYRDLATGKLGLALARGGYDVQTLPLLDTSTITALTSYSRTGWDETTNEVRVSYTDIDAGHVDRQAVAQDIANWQRQGAVISSAISYPGCGRAGLAAQLAARDLKALTYPLAKASVSCKRLAAGYVPGDVVRWSWPPLGITDLVMRVQRVDIGTLTDGTVKLDLVQDVFAVADAIYATPPATGWTDPIQPPQAVLNQVLREATAYEVMTQVLGDLDSAVADFDTAQSAVPAYTAVRPQASALYADAWASLSGGAYTEVEQVAFTPSAQLAAAVDQLTAVLSYSGDTDLEGVVLPALALLGDECIRVDAIDSLAGTLTVGRGCLDTPPVPHALGERLDIVGDSATLDMTVAHGTALAVKALTATARGQIGLAEATAATATLDGRRFSRPLAPGYLYINGARFPVEAYGDLVAGWRHRDRRKLDALVSEADNTSYGPEAGVTYTARWYVDGVLARTQAGLTGTDDTFTPPAGSTGKLVRVEISAVRDGLESWQPAMHEFLYLAARITEGSDTRITEAGDRRILE